ncbi:MAG TPA: MFS transporter [Candidatus Tyrphobacter sp.]
MLRRSTPFRFVFIFGIVSLFADMTYEGGRSIAGPFLAQLGASGLVVGFIAGFGELLGYGLRVLSGTAADRTRRYWPIAFIGYAVNLLCVPALAIARTWPAAGALLIGERVGRGIRKPSVSAMLSHAGSQIGQGWVFGFHEAMDQVGATVGPLVVAAILALNGGFSMAFGALAIPAVLSLVALGVARFEYPLPGSLEKHAAPSTRGFGSEYWLYVAAGTCVAAGFADFALVSFHFSKAHVIANHVIPILYAAAMLVGVVASPLFGRLYDRFPLATLLGAFAASALFAPLCFLGGTALAIAGVLFWGLGMAAQETLLPSMIARLTPPDRRATALGAFDGFYGVAWFVGSAAMGALYDRSLLAVVIFSLALQIAALPLFLVASRMQRAQKGGEPPLA